MKELFCACVGSEVRLYCLEGGQVRPPRSLALDAPVQYACANGRTGVSYFVTSDGGPFEAGSRHHLHALAPTERGQPLVPICGPVALPSRPIHVGLDATGDHVLVTFNRPPEFRLYAVDAHGRITTEGQAESNLGIAPHQGLISPDNSMLIVSERGNDAIGTRAPISGAMRIFDYLHGHARHRQTITGPWEGGFEPRNVLFHPDKPLIYLVLESQNLLLVYQRNGSVLQPRPLQTVELLSDPADARPGQIAGAVKMNHADTRLYVANRAHGHTVEAGMRVFAGGENSIAHFSVDHDTGLLGAGERAAVNGIGPRNISISADDRWLFASSWMAHLIKAPDGTTTRVEAGFDVYELDGEGKPHHRHWEPVATSGTTLFWSGFLPA